MAVVACRRASLDLPDILSIAAMLFASFKVSFRELNFSVLAEGLGASVLDLWFEFPTAAITYCAFAALPVGGDLQSVADCCVYILDKTTPEPFYGDSLRAFCMYLVSTFFLPVGICGGAFNGDLNMASFLRDSALF